jgi:hypothetical protein
MTRRHRLSGASAKSHCHTGLPLPASLTLYSVREALPGSPSKSLPPTPSDSVITLSLPAIILVGGGLLLGAKLRSRMRP